MIVHRPFHFTSRVDDRMMGYPDLATLQDDGATRGWPGLGREVVNMPRGRNRGCRARWDPSSETERVIRGLRARLNSDY
jgi:hypothetical protein